MIAVSKICECCGGSGDVVEFISVEEHNRRKVADALIIYRTRRKEACIAYSTGNALFVHYKVKAENAKIVWLAMLKDFNRRFGK